MREIVLQRGGVGGEDVARVRHRKSAHDLVEHIVVPAELVDRDRGLRSVRHLDGTNVPGVRVQLRDIGDDVGGRVRDNEAALDLVERAHPVRHVRGGESSRADLDQRDMRVRGDRRQFAYLVDPGQLGNFHRRGRDELGEHAQQDLGRLRCRGHGRQHRRQCRAAARGHLVHSFRPGDGRNATHGLGPPVQLGPRCARQGRGRICGGGHGLHPRLQRRLAAERSRAYHLDRFDQRAPIDLRDLVPYLSEPIRQGHGRHCAANVVTSLDAIKADLAHVTTITLSGSAVVLTTAQAAAYADVLGKIVVASGSTPLITVTDTAANIVSALASSTVGALPVVFKVVDTGANISANLDALSDPRVASITDMDNQAITATVAQMTQDAAAFAKLQYQSGASYQITIADTAANVQAGIATLASNWRVASITATGGVPAFTVAQLGSSANALYKIAGGFNVADTAANIVVGLSTLQTFPTIQTIQSTDGNTPAVSDATFGQYKGVLDKITGGLTLSGSAVVLTTAQAAAYADVLGKIVVASGSTPLITVTDTAANIVSALASSTVGALPVVFKVVDTGANISANLDALSDPCVASITDMDNQAITATVAQMTQDAAAFAKLQYQSGASYQITIADTAANVQAGIATLASNWRVASITATGGVPAFTVAQLGSSANAPYKIAGGFNVADTAANIVVGLSTLQTFPTIQTIQSTDGNRPAVSDATFGQYKGVLDKITGGLTLSGSAATIAYDSTALAKDAHIASLTATDWTVTISVTRFLTYQSLFDKVTGGIALSGSAANVVTSLDAIQ